MAHTTGPWEVHKAPSGRINVEVPVRHGVWNHIAEVVTVHDNGEANAQVLAAAPTMLDALKEAAECLAHTGPETTIKAVNAAIKLAEG